MAQQEELLKFAAIGVGAFLLGRMTAPKEATTVNVVPVGEGAPIPPLPPPATPLEPQGDAPAGTYQSRWDNLAFDVGIYPSYADPTRISPPLGMAEPAVAEDCSIVALPVGWWDRAGTLAQEAIDQGFTDRAAIVEEIMVQLLPECVGSTTAATLSVKTELDARLRELLPDVVFPPPPPPAPVVITNPGYHARRNPLTPTTSHDVICTLRPRRSSSRRGRRTRTIRR